MAAVQHQAQRLRDIGEAVILQLRQQQAGKRGGIDGVGDAVDPGGAQEFEVEFDVVPDDGVPRDELPQLLGDALERRRPATSWLVIPVSRSMNADSRRPGFTRLENSASSPASVKRMAPTSMIRSRAGSRPVVSRSSAM
ncbi:MAG: hypothetical protein WHT63_08905 [Tepidiforma sp.]